MNSWLQQTHSRLYSELDSLQTGHPSGRENGRWIAETQGKLDACTLLKDSPVEAQRIDIVRRTFDGKPHSDVDEQHIQHYRKGAIDFLESCSKMLADG